MIRYTVDGSCGTAVPDYITPADCASQLGARNFVCEVLVPYTRARSRITKKSISKVVEHRQACVRFQPLNDKAHTLFF